MLIHSILGIKEMNALIMDPLHIVIRFTGIQGFHDLNLHLSKLSFQITKMHCKIGYVLIKVFIEAIN